MMNKEKMLRIAERNLKKANIALHNNYNRQGIMELEKEKLDDNVEYAKAIYELIVNHVD